MILDHLKNKIRVFTNSICAYEYSICTSLSLMPFFIENITLKALHIANLTLATILFPLTISNIGTHQRLIGTVP